MKRPIMAKKAQERCKNTNHPFRLTGIAAPNGFSENDCCQPRQHRRNDPPPTAASLANLVKQQEAQALNLADLFEHLAC